MAIPVMAKDNSIWTLEQSVDDFGDKSGNPVIQSEITGTFSNTATSESDLKVIAYIILFLFKIGRKIGKKQLL